MRRRSSSELFNLSRRRSSLDVVTEKEVALFSQRKKSTSSITEPASEDHVKILETIPQHANDTDDASVERDLQQSKGTEVTLPQLSEGVDVNTEAVMDSCDNEACEPDIEVTSADQDTVTSEITEKAPRPGTKLKRTPSEESRLQRAGARYFNRRARMSEGIVQGLPAPPSSTPQSAPPIPSDGELFSFHSPPVITESKNPVTKPHTRKFTYDIAMGVISMDAWSQMIDEHETKKQKKVAKEKKDKSGKHGRIKGIVR